LTASKSHQLLIRNFAFETASAASAKGSKLAPWPFKI